MLVDRNSSPSGCHIDKDCSQPERQACVVLGALNDRGEDMRNGLGMDERSYISAASLPESDNAFKAKAGSLISPRP